MKNLSSIVFAGALLLGACSTTRTTTVAETTDDYGQVSAEASVTAPAVPITGPAKVDSEGRVYTSSAAPGSGNASSLGTNTNVNIIPDEPQASVTVAQTNIIAEPVPEPVDNEVLVTESTAMISAAQEETPATTQVEPATTTQTTTTRTRMRKD